MRRTFPRLLVLAIALPFLGSCRREGRTTSGSGACPERTCETIGSQGGKLYPSGTGTELDQVRVDVPRGAVREGVEISVASGDRLDEATLAGHGAVGPVVRFEPDGQLFAKPARVELPFQPRTGMDPRRLFVIVANRDTRGKVRTETLAPERVDLVAGVVTVLLRHFSSAVVVEKRSTDAPYVASFGLTQKDGPSASCVFSRAPRTVGEIEIHVDAASGTARVSLTGGGNGKRNLHCVDADGAHTGFMVWTQSYAGTAAGVVDAYGVIKATGTLTGTGTEAWSDCSAKSAPTACPAPTSDRYSFPFTIEGSVHGGGTMVVTGVKLDTRGIWSAHPPAVPPVAPLGK